jgi:hypothetical protein
MGINRGSEHLLDAGDTVIGNLVSPLGQNGSWNGNQIILTPANNPDRIIDLTAESKTGQMATVAITANCTLPVPLNESPNFQFIGGPVTARIEFGNGAQFAAVEVDVPVTVNPAAFNNPNLPASQGGNITNEGGTLVTVPAGVLRVYGRDDSNLVTQSIQYAGTGFGVPVAFGAPFNGGGNIPRGVGPWWQGYSEGGAFAALTAAQVLPVPVNMKAAVAYFTRPGGNLTRNTKTLWVYNSVPGPGADTNIQTGAGGPAIYLIPPFAKSFSIWRNKTDPATFANSGPTAGATLTIFDSLLYTKMPMTTFTVAGGAASPDFELPMSAVAIGVQTTTDTVTSFALVFEIGI